MSLESPASSTSGVSASFDDVEAADAAEQMAAATSVLRPWLTLLGDSQPVDPYPM